MEAEVGSMHIPSSYKEVRDDLIAAGFEENKKRGKGSHRAFIKAGYAPVLVPFKKDIPKGTVLSILKSAGIR